MEPLPLTFLPHVDELLMEYLLFRGFTKVRCICLCIWRLLEFTGSRAVAAASTQSFQVFNAERKRSRVKGFDVEQILSQLLASVQRYTQVHGCAWRLCSSVVLPRGLTPYDRGVVVSATRSSRSSRPGSSSRRASSTIWMRPTQP